jgi:hypothetical protein
VRGIEQTATAERDARRTRAPEKIPACGHRFLPLILFRQFDLPAF